MANKIYALIAIICLSTIVLLSTGAFSSVTAERTATINVAGDQYALLGIEKSSGPNGAYADYDSKGALYINFDTLGGSSDHSGVNVDAITIVNNVFTVRNNGTQTVNLYVRWGTNMTKSEAENVSSSNETSVFEIYPENGYDPDTKTGSSYPVQLSVGDTVSFSIWINTNGLSQNDTILSKIWLVATAGSDIGTNDDDGNENCDGENGENGDNGQQNQNQNQNQNQSGQ